MESGLSKGRSMSVQFVTPVDASSAVAAADPAKLKRAPRHHHSGAKPLPVANIALDQKGILRVGHLLTLLSLTSTKFYSRLNAGLIPPPCGNDGRPFWTTRVVSDYLDTLAGGAS